jgi:hypothetical protein
VETRIGGEMRRAGVEKRAASRKLEVVAQRFEVTQASVDSAANRIRAGDEFLGILASIRGREKHSVISSSREDRG